MAIPADYFNLMCQSIRSSFPENKVYVNSTGADVVQGDFVVISGKICGVVDRDSLNGATVSLTVDDKLEILTTEIAAASTFDAQGNIVFWDAVAKEFTDVSASGLFEVGFIITPKNASGLIRFQMYNVVKSEVA